MTFNFTSAKLPVGPWQPAINVAKIAGEANKLRQENEALKLKVAKLELFRSDSLALVEDALLAVCDRAIRIDYDANWTAPTTLRAPLAQKRLTKAYHVLHAVVRRGLAANKPARTIADLK